MTDEAPGVPITGVTNNPAHLSDEMTAELSGPDREGVKGPAVEEWGEAQLVPSPDAPDAAAVPQGEVKGPDEAKWGTDADRAAAEEARIASLARPADAPSA